MLTLLNYISLEYFAPCYCKLYHHPSLESSVFGNFISSSILNGSFYWKWVILNLQVIRVLHENLPGLRKLNWKKELGKVGNVLLIKVSKQKNFVTLLYLCELPLLSWPWVTIIILPSTDRPKTEMKGVEASANGVFF